MAHSFLTSLLLCTCTPLLFLNSLRASSIERIWLSHSTTQPEAIVVNWETETALDSIVEFGFTKSLGQTVAHTEKVTLHHVSIPLIGKDRLYYYRVRSGSDSSTIASFKGYPSEQLRVVVVGDWGYSKVKDFSAILKDDPHLLLTVGDNVANLHEKGREGTQAFSALIDQQPALFRSIPFMPLLGNHDREITSRGPGPKPPAHAVYDIEARAYREFFALPGDEWKWHFDLPDFNLRFIALDLNHISDFGTNWQTCHPYDSESEQFIWYRDLMSKEQPSFVLTLMNEKQTSVQSRTKGVWHAQFGKGSALITGFGYFADRAVLKGGLPYYNTCLKGDGSPYKDPQSVFFAQQDNYLLLTMKKGAETIQARFKNMQGDVLDDSHIEQRKH
jgi:hypothetical protein